MRQKTNNPHAFLAGLVVALCAAAAPVLSYGPALAAQKQEAQPASAAEHKQAFADFDARVKEYVKLREHLNAKLPKLAKESKPEQLRAHETALEGLVRGARVDAKPGDIFTPIVAAHIRSIIREFKGVKLQDVRETILEADTKGVPLKVNYPYPDNKELTQIPPTLLLKLPQLPDQVRYRFVGRHMLLVDKDNDLILDYMLNALP
jgi:hypothetical protein